jgi:EAL domain-containing protein (putative c-di-GMP-specific phosphodiesterase class I)
MKHHPLKLEILTRRRHPARGPWQPVSFTGAVSSQRVTEECEGWLNPVGNRVASTWI